MQLLTDNILRVLPPLGSTQTIPIKDKIVICQFYLPDGRAWYVFEGQVDAKKQYRFFGMIVHENKIFLGYFYLDDLFKCIEPGCDLGLHEPLDHIKGADILSQSFAHASPFCKRFFVEEIIRALPPIYSTDHISLEDQTIICRFYFPNGWNWYVFEGELDHHLDYRFFGMIIGAEKEFGYFHFSELLELENGGHSILVDYSPTFNVRYSDIFKSKEKTR